MSTYGTKFVETEALCAVMNDDTEEAYKILNELLPGKLGALRRHARELADMCADTARAQAQRATEGAAN